MPPGAGGEIQLTDGIARLLEDEKVLAYEFEGRRYDCGNKLGYLEATVELGAEASRSRPRLRRVPQAHAMTFNELRYIVAVAQEKNFGRAAQHCFISQPALSVAIQKLEEELGAQLFERGKSEVTVTPVGERIVEQAQKVLEEAARIRDIAQAGTQPAGRPVPARRDLHRRALPAAGPDSGAERARAGRCRWRSRKTSPRTWRPSLRAGRIDAAIIALPFNPPGIATDFLYEEPFQVVVPREPRLGQAQVDRPLRACRRAHDPAQCRPLLSRPGARLLPGAQSLAARR